MFLLVLWEFDTMRFDYIHPLSSISSQICTLLYATNFMSLFKKKSFKADLCYANILECVIFHWAVVNLTGTTLLGLYLHLPEAINLRYLHG